ncbi:hypothetical protein ACEWY4_024107 [Coilia grayii]|uniref:Ig-like domain-containing protein n=1 Tax=Coilia grayii TaxID=363190 RepID=A0ABD1IZF1_9TELE
MRSSETVWLDLLVLLNVFTRGLTIRRVSVPEEHFLFLHCDSDAENTNIEWKNGAGQILATKSGAAVSYLNQNKYHISEGYLHIKEVERSDAGEYYCNGRLEAEVEVLRGQFISVSEGRSLFIPCESERKQVWSFRKERSSQRVNLFTVFRNGTVIRERDDPQGRFVPHPKALEIVRLELEDSGRYLCNMRLVARLTVIKGSTPFGKSYQCISNIHQVFKLCLFLPVAVVAVVGLCVLVASIFLVSLIVCQRKRMRKRRNKKIGRKAGAGQIHEETELQPQGPSIRGKPTILLISSPAESSELHYASLGRKNWLERGRMQDKGHHVIYSTVAVAMNQNLE